jgi:Flp pilus assembly protein TadG
MPWQPHESVERGVKMSRRRRDDGGAVAVEFALLAPIFIMLLFGIISFGLVFAQKLALGNGARQGARLGVVSGVTCAQIYSAAQNASSTIGMSSSAVTVSITRVSSSGTTTTPCGTGSAQSTSTTQPCAGSATGDSIYVTESYTTSLIIPPVIFNNNYVVNGNGQFECEFS